MTIVLIGPMCAGKSTVAPLLAQRLGRPRVEMDELRWDYYAEIGYDQDQAQTIMDQRGMAGLLKHWKPFEAHAVERIVAEYPEAVIDLGAGHSVYTDQALFDRVKSALASAEAIILLLPSADLEASITILNERLRELLNAEVGVVDPAILAINEHFVRHQSNENLAMVVFYTDGKTPEDVVKEIVCWLA